MKFLAGLFLLLFVLVFVGIPLATIGIYICERKSGATTKSFFQWISE